MPSIEQLKELIKRLGEKPGLIDFYTQEAESLTRKSNTVRICDFDDTLFSREEQLQDKDIRENRGAAGIELITNRFGIHSFIEQYYSHKNLPGEIQELLDTDSDLILTAGLRELQELKIRATGLTKYNLKVVYEGKDKILETIRYALFELKYIPTEIIIYEDRPQFFEEYRELIESVLGTKLTIMKVEMDGNRGYKEIEEI